MATDIHILIEQRDTSGQWNAIWQSYLYYSHWFKKRFLDPIDIKHFDDPHKIRILDIRSYQRFAVLSGTWPENPFAKYDVGTKDTGIAQVGWPQDTSYAARHFDHQYYHTRGWITLANLRDIQARLNQLDLKDPTEIACEDAYNTWMENLERAVSKLTGPNALMKQIIGRVPEKEEINDPDYPIHDLGSAHASLSIVNGGRWSDLCAGADNIRILICYDH